MTFGEILRKIRRDKKISQRALADKLGISFTYLSKIENDVMPPPSEELLIKLAKELDIDIDEFMIEANKVPTDIQQTIMNNPKIPKFLRSIDKITDEKWKKIEAILEEEDE